MTNAEFERLYKQARVHTSVTSLRAQTELRAAYIAASKVAADRIRDIETRGLSELSLSLWIGIQSDLKEAIAVLNEKTAEIAVNGISTCAETYNSITAKYLLENARNEFISEEGILKVKSVMNKKTVNSIVNRTFQDGYSFSNRVWKAGEFYQDTIKQVVAQGIAVGRDPVKIAKDIEAYTVDGRQALANRWANIERGTKEWTKRVPQNIDYRAVRLVRSEIQMSIQEAGMNAGKFNVASTGKYRWLLGPGLAHCSTCIDYSLQEFTEETLPGYPHSNCGCVPEPVMRDLEQFTEQLVGWVNGEINEENRYIDLWYEQRYKPALAS